MHADTVSELEKTRGMLQMQYKINTDYQKEVCFSSELNLSLIRFFISQLSVLVYATENTVLLNIGTPNQGVVSSIPTTFIFSLLILCWYQAFLCSAEPYLYPLHKSKLPVEKWQNLIIITLTR